MPRIKVPGFNGGAYTLRSVNVDAQRAVNVYPEQDESGQGKDQEALSMVSRPGLKLFATLFSGPIRGMWLSSSGRVFAQSGNNLCEVLSNGSAIQYGTTETDSGTVSMSDNGKQLLMVDGDKGYILTLDTGILTAIESDAFPNEPQFVAFLNSFFLVNNAQSRQISFSGIYDGTSWDGLDIFSKEKLPDNVRAIVPASGTLYVVGDLSYECFADTTDPLDPFQSIEGAFGEVGIRAPQTLKVVDRAPLFVGNEKAGANMVYRFQGWRPVRISNYAVEQAIDSYGDISKATAFGYQRGGHTFYNINFPNANTTWSYDVATGLWHEETWTDENGYQHRHRAEHHVFGFGKHLVGDWQNGNIYELDDNKFSDNGATITKLRTFPHFSDQQRTIFHRRLEIYMETGVGCAGTGDTGQSIPISTVSGILGFAADLDVRDVTVVTLGAHGFVAGQQVVIDGVADATFNGSYTVGQILSTTSFLYAQPNGGLTLVAADSTGGTATPVV